MSEKEMHELNCFVAEHVMGWVQRDVAPSRWFPDGWKKAWINPKGGADTLPRFTTDPAAAASVWKKCLEKVSTRSVETYIGCDEAPEYRRIYCISLSPSGNVTMADTWEMAVCLFAQEIHEAKI